ncbi:GDSL-type esterase/lipase family protein [Mollicutes bacterium LVI A0039]|nr:GDSL-type esterase/lipase family protein [Mollicutes bacterium LVI A0039]
MQLNYMYTDIKNKVFEERNMEILARNFDFDLILLGDSITEGFDLNRYGYTNKTYLNSGIGGDRIEYMHKRLDRDVLQFSPREVLFMGGINDIRAWYAEGNDLSNIEEITTHIIKYTSLIVNELKENGIDVKICTITKNYERDINFDYINHIIDHINIAIKNLAIELDVILIDYNEVLTNKYGYLDLSLSYDGLHPNEFGYIEMVKQIRSILIK